MSSASNSQQKLFGMIRAYQKGKISDNIVSPAIKKLAKVISPENLLEYAKTTDRDLDDILEEIYSSPAYIEETLREINETKQPAIIKGEMIDIYTASMLQTVVENMTPIKRSELLKMPVHQMVAVSYKMLNF
jgi:hypothetical protein